MLPYVTVYQCIVLAHTVVVLQDFALQVHTSTVHYNNCARDTVYWLTQYILCSIIVHKCTTAIIDPHSTQTYNSIILLPYVTV
jgi:uncharacterized membrane protein (DUF106 family)